MESFRSRKRGIPALILTTVFLTALLTVFGRSLIRERLDDMEGLLEYASRQQIRDRTFLITSKIKLLRKRMNNSRETKQDFVDEFKVQRILALDNKKEKKQKRTSLFSPMTGLIRKLMGKPVAIPRPGVKNDPALEKAYLEELTRRYKRAASLFERVIRNGEYSGSLKEDYIRLHIGFCQTMAGNFRKSRKQYVKLLKKGKAAELKTLAVELLDFSIISEIRINELAKKRLSSLDRAEEHLRIHNIPTAVALIKDHLKKNGALHRDRALYLLGRCREEQGIIKGAITSYTDVLLMNMDSWWARMANRRLYIIGQVYYRNRELRKLAEKNSRERYKEDDLFKKVSMILKQDKPSKEKQSALNPGLAAKLKKIRSTKKAEPVISETVKTQVKILARRYTVIRMLFMKNGMRIVGSILSSSTTHNKLATVNGVISLPRAEILRSVILFRK